VTTRASDSLLELHDRMPVILDTETEAAWLDPGTAPGELRELLVPLPDAATTRRPVGSAVNDARFDGPECLYPPPADVSQPALF
jgi:putative SOS response-associated peptidase YedK